MKALKWIAGIIVGIFVFFFVAGMVTYALKSPEERAAFDARAEATRVKKADARQAAEAQAAQQTADGAQAEAGSLLEVTANEMAQAYATNTVAADQSLKGKRFKVSGTVVEISTDFLGDPYITLRGGVNEFMEPQFSFDKSQLSGIGQLRPGQRVSLACTGAGDIAKSPMSKECTLL